MLLLQAVKNEEGEVTEDARALWLRGKWSDPRPSWGREYVHALQAALEGRDDEQLLNMLEAAVPLSELLLPALARVLRYAKKLPRKSGRPSRLTVVSDASVRWMFDWLTTYGHPPLGTGEAHRYLASARGVSEDTIIRSLQRTKTSAK